MGKVDASTALDHEAGLRSEPLNGWQQLVERTKRNASRFGAVSSFVGVMRDFNDGEAVEALFVEHYPGMTESALSQLAADALEQFSIGDVLLLHRVGNVNPGEELVVIGVWSVHRAEAFAATEWLIEALKHRVPLWKKERRSEGDNWVSENTAGRSGPGE